jgi:hypothetical protein
MVFPRARRLASLLWAGAALAAAGCGGGGSGGAIMTRAQLLDPQACMGCHPTQFTDWSGSMHAYASDDPVFLAMNARGQHDTGGALGKFCVQCHAPMAVHEGATTDGLNLATVDPSLKGVTCYFCHAATAVEGSHNNPLTLATGNQLYGPFGDPAPQVPHSALYSPLLDLSRAESAAACGACHDIQNQHGTDIERTYQEWQGTLFSNPSTGLTCASNSCHMALPDSGPGPASTVSPDRKRDLHSHAFPGVDVALTPFPQADAQKQQIQTLLDGTMLTTVCFNSTTQKIWVILDPAGAGHSFPSGATQDRRAWVEVAAYAGGQLLYQSGVVPPGQDVQAITDPDLWLIRDCIYGADGQPVDMFWDAARYTSNQLPGSVLPNVADPSSFTRSHIKGIYPGGAAPLAATPDRIAVKVHIKPIGGEVLADLVAGGYLDPTVAATANATTFDLGNGGTIEWTPDAAGHPIVLPTTQETVTCVVAGGNRFADTPNIAVSHAVCND